MVTRASGPERVDLRDRGFVGGSPTQNRLPTRWPRAGPDDGAHLDGVARWHPAVGSNFRQRQANNLLRLPYCLLGAPQVNACA